MRTILCFGDSNTWGYDADGTAAAASALPLRHAPGIRWTGILQRELGPGFRVIEDAQNGRTTVHDDPMAPACRNARRYLPTCLDAHKPIDLVVLMLGTNDLKTFLNLPPQDIANGVALLMKLIARSESGPGGRAPRILLVSPPALGDLSHLPDLAARLLDGREKSLALAPFYEAAAKAAGAAFLDAKLHTTASPVDAIHLDAASHERLGIAIAASIRAAFA